MLMVSEIKPPFKQARAAADMLCIKRAHVMPHTTYVGVLAKLSPPSPFKREQENETVASFEMREHHAYIEYVWCGKNLGIH